MKTVRTNEDEVVLPFGLGHRFLTWDPRDLGNL